MIAGPKRRRWIGLGAALILVCLVIGSVAWAPYLPRLFYEGFPDPVWPARGSFAEVPGTKDAPAIGHEKTPISTLDPQLREFLADKTTTAFLAAHDGNIAVEWYAEGSVPETRFNSYSLVKSLVGALILKAVADGRIDSLDEPIGTFLPNYGSAGFRSLPLRALLEMRSGIKFETGTAKNLSGEPVKDLESAVLNPFGPLARLHMLGPDAIGGALLRDEAGVGQFNYQNINTALLGKVLERAYGEPLQDILSRKIWAPAGAADASWRKHGEDTAVSAYCCLYARARDWIKVAVFLSRNGREDAYFLPEALWNAVHGHAFHGRGTERRGIRSACAP